LADTSQLLLETLADRRLACGQVQAFLKHDNGSGQVDHLARWSYRNACDGFRRTLRFEREPTERLNLISEELDAHRLRIGCWVHIDDAASVSDVTGLLNQRDRAVSEVGQRPGQFGQADLLSYVESDAGRAL
jgi:hypothetical protein